MGFGLCPDGTDSCYTSGGSGGSVPDSGGSSSGADWLSGIGSIISSAGSAFSNVWRTVNPPTPTFYPGVGYVTPQGSILGTSPFATGNNSGLLLIIAAIAAIVLLRK